MQSHSFQSLALPALAAAALLISPACFGATISNVSYTNTSGPDSSEDGVSVRNQFRSSGSVGGVVTNGNSVSVTTTTQWVAAYQVNNAGPANVFFVYPSLHLSFTVDDPGNVGYELEALSLTRGYLAAVFAGGTDFELGITASGTSLLASFDSGSGPGLNLQFSSFGESIAANSTNTNVGRLVTSSGGAVLGSFTGTRNFDIVLSYNPSPAGTIIFQNDFRGEAALRFGMSTTVPGLTLSTYPGPEGEAASTHGNFLTVTATFNESTEAVPEPTTTALFGAGLVVLGFVARRRR